MVRPRTAVREFQSDTVIAGLISSRSPETTRALWRLAPEACLALLIVAAGAAIGASYHQAFRESGGREDFGQYTFAAAVALVCGHGFSDIGADEIGPLTPELNRFLTLERDTFDCSALPSEIPSVAPNLTQGLYRYLMSAVAAVWMVQGISWSGLSPLFGLAYGLTLAAAYGLFRLGMGRILALLATAALAASALHLGYLPHLRDYAKAPFMLALLLIMAHMAREPFGPRRALWLSAAFGVVLGIGFGFRNDLLITTLPWVAVVLLCVPVRLREQLRLKAACLAVSSLVFLVAAAPVLTAYGRGSNTGHVALLGVMTPFDAALGVAGSIYEWGYVYSDHLTSAVITSYAYRTSGQAVEYLSAAYDAAAIEYLLAVAWLWPADWLIRAYGAVLQVLDLPFTSGLLVNPVPRGLEDTWAIAFYDWQQGLIRVFEGTGPYLAATALALIAATSVRVSLTLLVFVLYFAGYPAIQFHPRHYFHLEFITWWALGFLVQRAILALRQPQTRAAWRSALAGALPRVAAFTAVAALLILAPVATLRAYQQRSLTDVLARSYLGAARDSVPVGAEDVGDDRTLMTLPTLWDDQKEAAPADVAYLVAEFSSTDCPATQLSAAFRFRDEAASDDFRKGVDVKVTPRGEPTIVFFPVYRAPALAEFRGVELLTAEAGCLTRLSRVQDSALPALLVGLNLSPAWQDAKLYQTLVRFETSADGLGPSTTYAAYPPGALRPDLQRATSLSADAAVLPSGPDLVTRHDAGWRLQGRPSSAYAYLLSLPPAPAEKGATLVVEGELRRGGLTVGALRNDRWAGSVNITTRGPFIATVTVDDEGEYVPIVASYGTPRAVDTYVPSLRQWLPSLLTRSSPVDADIIKAGWIRAADQ